MLAYERRKLRVRLIWLLLFLQIVAALVTIIVALPDWTWSWLIHILGQAAAAHYLEGTCGSYWEDQGYNWFGGQ